MFLSRISLLLALLISSYAAHSCTDERINELINRIPGLLTNAKVAGMNVAVVCDGKAFWKGTFGLANTTLGKKLHIDDLFEAASNGKMITAYLVQLLAVRGLLSLDEEVNDTRLVSGACGLPTIRELLSHTAGLSNDLSAEKFVIDCDLQGTFSYAGQGYLVIQSLLARRTGMPTGTLFSTEVFEPLGMKATTFASLPPGKLVSGHGDLVLGFASRRASEQAVTITGYSLLVTFALIGTLAYLYTRNRTWKLKLLAALTALVVFFTGSIAVLYQIVVPVEAGNRADDLASSLKTNVTDLAVFATELLSPTQLDSDRIKELFRPIVQVNADTHWGAGFGIDTLTDPPTVWHWGANPGFQSLVVMHPETGNAVVVLTNTGGLMDYFSDVRGGHNAAKAVARMVLNRNGRWDTD